MKRRTFFKFGMGVFALPKVCLDLVTAPQEPVIEIDQVSAGGYLVPESPEKEIEKYMDVYVGGTRIGRASACSIDIPNPRDITTKDSNGWKDLMT